MSQPSQGIIMVSIRAFTAIFVICTLPFSLAYDLFCWTVSKIKSLAFIWASWIIRLLVPPKIIQLIKNWILQQKQISTERETHWTEGCLSPRSRETHINRICQKVKAEPKEQTPNHKILFLVQKMEGLQKSVFENSKQKCKIQKQLFMVNIEMIEKQALLVRAKKQNIDLLRKVQVIQSELQQRQIQLDQCNQMVQILQDEVTDFNEKLKELAYGNSNPEVKDLNQLSHHLDLVK